MPRAGRRRERSLLVRRPENPKDLVTFREIEKPCVCVHMLRPKLQHLSKIVTIGLRSDGRVHGNKTALVGAPS